MAESAGLAIDLRRELQGRQLVKLLTADPLSGGGPAEASRFLSSLHDSDDALRVAMGAMQLLPNLRSKQLLVIVFLPGLFSFMLSASFSDHNQGCLVCPGGKKKAGREAVKPDQMGWFSFHEKVLLHTIKPSGFVWHALQ